MMNNSRRPALLALATILCIAIPAFAQDNEFITYKIKSGDTFSKVTQKYLQAPVDGAAIQKINQLKNLNQLVVGSEMKIPRHMLKHTPAKATVMSISCVSPIRQSNNKPLTVGTVLREGAVIDIPAECHVALLLDDGSSIHLPSGASLKIAVLRKNNIEPVPEVRLDLTRGRIELDVNKSRGNQAPFEIRTPLSVMGVRGTEFRVGYSPDEQVGQVEVLGGTVETRGRADNDSQPITKGYGVPINHAGQALDIEKLLPAPAYSGFKATSGNIPSYVVQLTPVANAEYYVSNTASTANLSGARSSENLLAPEIFISKLTKQSVFYQLSSVSASGLMGTERFYAFCAPLKDDGPPRCSAIFDAPLADNSPISFSLSRMAEGSSIYIAQSQKLQAKNGRIAVVGLTPGHYHWSMSYPPQSAGGTAANNATVRQSGEFELIALTPASQP